MSNVNTYTFSKMPFRIVTKDDKKYFVIRDICDYLGFGNPNRELAKHTSNVPLYERIRTPGGLQVVRLVPREDVELLLAANHGRKAAKLGRWLKKKVYPAEFPASESDPVLNLLLRHTAFMREIMSVPLDQQPTVIFDICGIPLICGGGAPHAKR